jgi:hypothetical protein
MNARDVVPAPGGSSGASQSPTTKGTATTEQGEIRDKFCGTGGDDDELKVRFLDMASSQYRVPTYVPRRPEQG